MEAIQALLPQRGGGGSNVIGAGRNDLRGFGKSWDYFNKLKNPQQHQAAVLKGTRTGVVVDRSKVAKDGANLDDVDSFWVSKKNDRSVTMSTPNTTIPSSTISTVPSEDVDQSGAATPPQTLSDDEEEEEEESPLDTAVKTRTPTRRLSYVGQASAAATPGYSTRGASAHTQQSVGGTPDFSKPSPAPASSRRVTKGGQTLNKDVETTQSPQVPSPQLPSPQLPSPIPSRKSPGRNISSSPIVEATVTSPVRPSTVEPSPDAPSPTSPNLPPIYDYDNGGGGADSGGDSDGGAAWEGNDDGALSEAEDNVEKAASPAPISPVRAKESIKKKTPAKTPASTPRQGGTPKRGVPSAGSHSEEKTIEEEVPVTNRKRKHAPPPEEPDVSEEQVDENNNLEDTDEEMPAPAVRVITKKKGVKPAKQEKPKAKKGGKEAGAAAKKKKISNSASNPPPVKKGGIVSIDDFKDANGKEQTPFTRRSDRSRIPALAWWKNEKAVYEPPKHLDEVPTVTGVYKVPPTPAPVKKSKKKATKKRKLEHSDTEEDDAGAVDSSTENDSSGSQSHRRSREHAVGQRSLGRLKESKLPPLPDGCEYLFDEEVCMAFTGPDETAVDQYIISRSANRTNVVLQKEDGSDTACMAAEGLNFKDRSWATGTLTLPPHAIKKPEHVGESSQLYWVAAGQAGALEVAIETRKDVEVAPFDPMEAKRFVLSPGDHFWLPPWSVYRLENHSSVATADINWCIIKKDTLQEYHE